MATEILLPFIGESIEEAKIVTWFKETGDEVKRGEELAEIETDKATMPLECPENGVLLVVLEGEGSTVRPGQTLAVIGSPGEKWEKEHVPEIPPADAESLSPAPEKTKKARDEKTPDERGRQISPNARRLAEKLGIDIDKVQPKTPGARITGGDVERYDDSIRGKEAPEIPFHRVKLNSVQKIIAKRMMESAQSIPQFSVSVEADATQLSTVHKGLNSSLKGTGGRVSLTAILTYLTGRALRMHPALNAKYDEDSIIVYDTLNIGVATAALGGLRVPVIHGTQNLSLMDIAYRLEGLTGKAKEGRLTNEDLSDGTFTISNLGMFGISRFIPLVNPPQASILSMGTLRPAFLPDEEGKPRFVQLLDLTISADHRALDGVAVAKFLGTLKTEIEQFSLKEKKE